MHDHKLVLSALTLTAISGNLKFISADLFIHGIDFMVVHCFY